MTRDTKRNKLLRPFPSKASSLKRDRNIVELESCKVQLESKERETNAVQFCAFGLQRVNMSVARKSDVWQDKNYDKRLFMHRNKTHL